MTSRRRLRLAGPPELTTECVLPALAGLVANGLQLQVSLGRPAENLLRRLAAGEFDLVVSTIRPNGEGLVATRLPDEEFVLVSAPAWVDRVDPADPTDAPLIAVSSSMPVIRRYWMTVYNAEPPGPPAATVHDLRGAMNLVSEGAGITVLPRYLCRERISSGRLVDLVHPATVPTNELFLAGRAETGGLEAVKTAHDLLVVSAETW
ncbi:MAG: substrate-binding domain-containing protein [Actinomycetota bacterium]